jgi:cytochrome c oxidase cbb3-type subunit 3/ubiquinol-cytochrome c reductase cytochrome c subunit
MPSFAPRLGDRGVDDVLALLRSWQKTAPASHKPPAKLPPLPLGPVPLHPHGPEPQGFVATPLTTKVEIVKGQLDAGARFAQLPKDAWLVCYCSCPSAESGQLAKKLMQAGFTKVTVLEEGLRVWKAKKYATNTGFEP